MAPSIAGLSLLALLSVSDKRGLVPFAAGLLELGFQILSTGGTLQTLSAAGISARKVSDYTGSPEILGGRVKTLHPKIHGGLLGRPDLPADLLEMEANAIAPIAVVAVNLYPFRETVASGASEADIIENIDIGGPAMVRAAAKNGSRVTVVVDPDDYPAVLEELRRGPTSATTRSRLMRKAFAHTAAYDASIASYLQKSAGEAFPAELSVSFQKAQELRYGENPHQRGAFYRSFQAPQGPSLGFSQVLQGKELSYNNLLDLDAALALALEFPERPAAIIIKHNTPCGVALSDVLETAYRTARAIDEVRPSVASSRSIGKSTWPRAVLWPRPSSRLSLPLATVPRPGTCSPPRKTFVSWTPRATGRRRPAGTLLGVTQRFRRPLGAGPRRGRAALGLESRHPALAHAGRGSRPALRLAGVQAREEQRHCVLHRRPAPGRRRRPNQSRRLRKNRRRPRGARAAR